MSPRACGDCGIKICGECSGCNCDGMACVCGFIDEIEDDDEGEEWKK